MKKNNSQVVRIVLFTFLVLQIQIMTAQVQLKHQNKLTLGVEKYELIIKLKPSVINNVKNENLIFEDDFLENSTSVKQFDSFKFEQIISSVKNSQKLSKEKRAFDMNEFKGLIRVKGVSSLPKGKALKLANEFEKYSFVEYVTLRPLKAPPAPRTSTNHLTKKSSPLVHSVVATPDFTNRQGYLKDFIENDVFGINADYAHSIGIFGQGIKVADVEWGMDHLHEDLKSDKFIELIKGGDESESSHGTSVAGVLIGKNNGFGITGGVHQLDRFYGVSHYSTDLVYRPEHAILTALGKLDAGDVLILEMQTHDFEPIDIHQSIWDIIKTATDSGIIVVEAGGNGSLNLDSSVYDNFRNRGDNGVIRVGAGTRKGRNKLDFSNYGNSIHVQAWGEKVVTTGNEGNVIYDGGAHAAYIDNFSGTSSATPIVATSIVSMQSYAKNEFGVILKPNEVKDLLISTGRSQGAGGHIGPFPNIKKIFKKIEDEYGKIPSFSLPNKEWTIITLPADPGNKNTVQNILGDDIPGEAGIDWAVFGFNSITNKFLTYEKHNELKPGIAYWIYQESGATVTLDMPEESTRLSNQFKLQLNTQNGKTTWNFIGFPFTSEVPLSEIKVHTTEESCIDGCSINSQEVVDANFFMYKNGAYKKVRKIIPWEGFFAKTTTKSDGKNPYLKYSVLSGAISPSHIIAEQSSELPYSTPAKAFEISRIINSATIYPNPSKGIYNLKLAFDFTADLSIKIYSIDGKLVEEMELQKSNKTSIHQLDLSNYNSGVYIVNFTIGEHHYNHQIVKL